MGADVVMPQPPQGPLHRREDPHNVPLEQAREGFLRAYERCKPEVLTDLAKAPLKSFRQEGAGWSQDLWDKVRYSPKFPRLTRSLERWASKFHFHWQGEPAQWVMAIALSTLSLWAESRKARKKRQWHFPLYLHQEYLTTEAGLESLAHGRPDPDLAVISIEIPGWDLWGGESARALRRRALQLHKKAIEEYIQQIEARGWTRRPKLIAKDYIDGFALWQCGLNLEQVQRRLGLYVESEPDRTGTFHGIDRVARYIELDRRHPQRSSSS